jgi:hypothetical protein
VTEIASHGWISNVPEECVARGFCNVYSPLSVEEYKSDFETFGREVGTGYAWLRANPPTISWGPLEVAALVVSESLLSFLALAQPIGRASAPLLKGRQIGAGAMRGSWDVRK